MMHPFDRTPRSSRALALAAAAALTLGVLTPALAQQSPDQQAAPAQQTQPAQSAQPAPPAQQPPAADATQKPTIASAQVPDAEVEQFARAAGDVLKIQAEIKEKLVGATNPEMKEQLQQEANSRILATIKESGMDVERFNLIARSMNSDAELGRRVSAKMQELQKQAAAL